MAFATPVVSFCQADFAGAGADADIASVAYRRLERTRWVKTREAGAHAKAASVRDRAPRGRFAAHAFCFAPGALLFSFPWPGLRGCSAEVVVLEEAAFMNPELFFQVVVPLLGVKNTAVLAISTPQDEFNYYTELMALKDEKGASLFYSIVLGLVCDACKKTGEACNHLLAMSPDWKVSARQAARWETGG